MRSIVIPAYNEAATIGETLGRVAAHMVRFGGPFEIIVVDDGSRDQTADIVMRFASGEPRVKLVRHEHNRGKGASVRTGLREARGTSALFLDADLSAPPEAIGQVFDALNDHDLAIGSRHVPGAVISTPQPLSRRLASRAFNVFVRNLFTFPYRDTQCGCKALGPKALALARNLETDGWAFDVELLARAQRNGLRVHEIGIAWNDKGRSRVRFGHFGHIFQEVLRIKRSIDA